MSTSATASASFLAPLGGVLRECPGDHRPKPRPGVRFKGSQLVCHELGQPFFEFTLTACRAVPMVVDEQIVGCAD